MKIEKQAAVVAAGTPDKEQLSKINALAKGTLTEEQVYVFAVRLCDDQVDRDFERFSTQALHQLAPMFVGKTGIADHQWSADRQLARIFDAGVEYGQGAAFIKAWAYMPRNDKNQALIGEIEAGIKKEVSVGCAMGKSICSICGADYGSCEHRKGQQYGADVCVAVLSEPVDAYEFSFVAVPAQPRAGVLRKELEHGFEGDAQRKKLEKEAALGRQYRKELEGEFVRLALVLDFGPEEKALWQMASALEAEQLLACKKALEQRAAKLYPIRTQLHLSTETARESDSAFLI